MASVFLSYDRDDTDKARPVANALEKAGHSVFWDLHIRGGAQFAKVIEEALRAADAVVVLWSKQSVESAWVRDEAAAGRDSGRLIPTTIDGTEAPLGFRQFQMIDLRDCKKGARSRGCKELNSAIHAMHSGLEQPAAPAVPARRLKPWLLAAPAIAAVIFGAGYAFWPGRSSASVPTVTVVPASNGAMSQALSRDLLAKLGILQASDSSALQLVEEGGRKASDLIFKVDASTEASKASLLLLSGRNHDLLWSGDFADSSGNGSNLKQQLAYSAANVLECASDVYGAAGRSLEEQTRRLYLRNCGDFTQLNDVNLEHLTAAFRQVTRMAPSFASGWEKLLYADDELINTPPFDTYTPAAEARIRREIADARKVSPDMAAAYIVEADLARGAGEFMRSILLINRGAERNPDNADALSWNSLAFLEVGRMRDAVSQARRALQIRPFSPRLEEGLISTLMYAGQVDAAQQELARADALFPGATNLNEVRFRLNLRYGSPDAALKQIQRGQGIVLTGMETYLKARSDPTPANVQAAVQSARQQLDPNTNSTFANYLQVLGDFGRTDELIDFLLNWRDRKRLGFIGVLFRPPFHNFWRDPRSMRVAANFGFVGYWRSTGRWPDFCSWPDLPYDCKKEAAKLGA